MQSLRRFKACLPILVNAGRRRVAAQGFPLGLAGLTLGIAALALAGCASQPTAFFPASTNARQVLNLIMVVFGLAALVFVVVEGILIYVVARFRQKPADTLPQQSEGNPRLEMLWTALPAVVLLIVFVVSVQTLGAITSPPPPAASGTSEPALSVRVIGHQWWWEFNYPEAKFTTANEMHVPVGVPLDLEIESADVVHSFWVPQLAGQKDATPGHVNPLLMRVTEPGLYPGKCVEFCGLEHSGMQLQVVAESPEAFQAWVAAQQAPVAQMTGVAAQGEQAFLGGACIGCHAVNGTKAKGVLGPNLTHLASRKTFAGALFDTTPENLTRWLANPQTMKPGVLMPNLHLASSQIDQLVAYLQALK